MSITAQPPGESTLNKWTSLALASWEGFQGQHTRSPLSFSGLLGTVPSCCPLLPQGPFALDGDLLLVLTINQISLNPPRHPFTFPPPPRFPVNPSKNRGPGVSGRMGASGDDLGSVAAEREVVAKRGNRLSGVGGGAGTREPVWTPGTVHCARASPLLEPCSATAAQTL